MLRTAIVAGTFFSLVLLHGRTYRRSRNLPAKGIDTVKATNTINSLTNQLKKIDYNKS